MRNDRSFHHRLGFQLLRCFTSPKVEVLYGDEPLKDYYTLMDIAYFYEWRRVSTSSRTISVAKMTFASYVTFNCTAELWTHKTGPDGGRSSKPYVPLGTKRISSSSSRTLNSCPFSFPPQTGPIPLQYWVKPTRKRRRPSQAAAQAHSDGVNTSHTSESDSPCDKVHSPATLSPRASPLPSPTLHGLPPPLQSPNGTAERPNSAQRLPLAPKLGSNTRKVTVNGNGSGAATEETRGGDKGSLPPPT